MSRTDTERLDWLQETTLTLYHVTETVFVPRTDGTNRNSTKIVNVGWSLSSRTDECNNIRRAIDAGMDNIEESIVDEM